MTAVRLSICFAILTQAREVVNPPVEAPNENWYHAANEKAPCGRRRRMAFSTPLLPCGRAAEGPRRLGGGTLLRIPPRSEILEGGKTRRPGQIGVELSGAFRQDPVSGFCDARKVARPRLALQRVSQHDR